MSDKQDFEYKTVMVPIDEHYQQRCNDLKAEGWTTVEAYPPVAVYNLVRPKAQPQPAPGFGAVGKLIIDESKVHIVRDGEVVG